MTRTYTKGKRAEHEAETRDRIVEAALALHGEVGPSATTISMIAERAGVQRHTVYAHLPDERSIYMACSGLHLDRAPPPSPAAWETLNDPSARLKAALTALYGWFAENDALLAAVLRDAERNTVLAEVSGLRFGGPMVAIYGSLAAGLGDRGQAALTLALSFHTWRTLRQHGLAAEATVELMTHAVLTADR